MSLYFRYVIDYLNENKKRNKTNQVFYILNIFTTKINTTPILCVDVMFTCFYAF